MANIYDIVIIGSGLGGLECAVMLSREGYNVCVLEQHSVFGGCLQSFNRGGRVIDTGVHYVGSMGEGQIMNQYFKYFGIADKIDAVKLDSDFDTIVFGDGSSYNYVGGYDNFKENLVAHFPAERDGIERYCAKIEEIGSLISVEKHRSGDISRDGIDNLSVSAAGFIEDCVQDEVLRSVLAGTNCLYAGVKESSNLYHHAMINHSNIEGAHRFVGGSQKVADLLVQQIRDNGGMVVNRSKVVNISLKGDAVEYVELGDCSRVYGKNFISAIHPSTTFSMVDSTPLIKKAYRTRLNILKNTYGIFSVYLLMKPNTMRDINKNYYYYSGMDAWNTLFTASEMEVNNVLMSSQRGSMESKFSEVVTLMSPIDSSIFSAFSGTKVGRRGEDYEALKHEISNKIINFTSQFYPSLQSAIDKVYASTPLTYQDYTSIPSGAAYGLLKDYRNSIATHLPVRTKISNLFLTGQNLNVHGAVGVTLTSAITCGEFLGREYLIKKIGNA